MNRSIRFTFPTVLPLAFAAMALASPLASAQQATDTKNPAPPDGVLTQQEESQKVTSELVGLSLVDPAGNKVGRVSDLILDEDRKVVGLVVSIGGVLGIGDKAVGLPWEAVSVEHSNNGPVAVAVSLNEEQLAAAPKFLTQAEIKEQKAEQEALRRVEQQREQQRMGAGSGLPNRTPRAPE